MKADLKDELDKVNADAERLRAFNVSAVTIRSLKAELLRAGVSQTIYFVNSQAAAMCLTRRAPAFRK
ncbi:MAG TPA: hypothetical protein VLG46_01160 [Anaerolineae bacterium]|nr:hypothetical protein [Anaerolineae bacterium]